MEMMLSLTLFKNEGVRKGVPASGLWEGEKRTVICPYCLNVMYWDVELCEIPLTVLV